MMVLEKNLYMFLRSKLRKVGREKPNELCWSVSLLQRSEKPLSWAMFSSANPSIHSV